jgi:hypothetical protein
MADWYSDTEPAALAQYIELSRAMSVDDKIRAVLKMNSVLRTLVEESVRSMYPKADDREIFLRTAARFLDADIMSRVYGWLPEPSSR